MSERVPPGKPTVPDKETSIIEFGKKGCKLPMVRVFALLQELVRDIHGIQVSPKPLNIERWPKRLESTGNREKL